MRKIDLIIVHCTATMEGKHFTVEDVREWHLKQGWKDIGYHYLIYLDGSIHKGRPEEEIGAHCYGRNKTSIGVCYVGGLERGTRRAKDTRTPAQKEALIKLLQVLKLKYPKAKILGHRDLATRACPCFDAKKEYKWI